MLPGIRRTANHLTEGIELGAKLVHGIWPALCTAFDDSGAHVDTARQRALVRALIGTGIQGFFVCGSTGEGRVMTAVPNFAGFKFTDNDLYLFGQLIDRSDGELNAISGPDQMALPAMVMGADAAIGTTYNIMPGRYLQMRRAFEDGDLAVARDCQLKANRVIRLLIEVGVLPAVKQVLADRGTPVGPTRVVPPLGEAGILALHAGLEQLNFEVH